MYDDLRGFIDVIEKRNELLRIYDADPDLEIGAVTVLAGQQGENHPMVLFDKIKGYSEGFRVLTNLVTTKARSKIGAGIDPNTEIKDEVDFIVKMLDAYKPIHPREVSQGQSWKTERKATRSTCSSSPPRNGTSWMVENIWEPVASSLLATPKKAGSTSESTGCNCTTRTLSASQ